MDYRHTTSEEEYFYNLNRDLMKKNREKLDKQRAEQADAQMKAEHWMKCPKCGHDLKEIELSGIMIDKCTNCKGMFFDNGELEMLLEAKKPEGFLTHMKKQFFG